MLPEQGLVLRDKFGGDSRDDHVISIHRPLEEPSLGK